MSIQKSSSNPSVNLKTSDARSKSVNLEQPVIPDEEVVKLEELIKLEFKRNRQISSDLPKNTVQANIPQQKIPEASSPQKKIPEANIPQQKIPEASSPQKKIPEANIPQQKIPEASVPQQKIPEASVPQQKIPEANIPQQRIPEVNIPHQRIPEANIPQQSFPQASFFQPPNNLKTQKSIPIEQPQLDPKSLLREAYNDPQFKAMLEQLSKVFDASIEPTQWTDEKEFAHFAEPLVIPAPAPIVIPIPNINYLSGAQSLKNVGVSKEMLKPEVTFYPTWVENGNAQKSSANVSNLNLDTKPIFIQ